MSYAYNESYLHPISRMTVCGNDVKVLPLRRKVTGNRVRIPSGPATVTGRVALHVR
ncbi:protein of unknown function [Kyrpidia spormannii]|uniref:Uncharacterized protein n=1 Tax=Kyrpidia spormannii TaxID=2055160 RepID=A0ACA8Z6I7_9BACL|nr:protein of unknown function [Kyrpidia spormannii]